MRGVSPTEDEGYDRQTAALDAAREAQPAITSDEECDRARKRFFEEMLDGGVSRNFPVDLVALALAIHDWEAP